MPSGLIGWRFGFLQSLKPPLTDHPLGDSATSPVTGWRRRRTILHFPSGLPLSLLFYLCTLHSLLSWQRFHSLLSINHVAVQSVFFFLLRFFSTRSTTTTILSIQLVCSFSLTHHLPVTDTKRNMKVTLFLVALCASLASAGVVKTPVFDDQIVPNQGDDCALGVTTPQGCA